MRFRLVPKSSTLDDLGCWSAWKPFLLPWCTLLHHVICHPLLSYNTWLHPVSTDWLDLCHMLRGRGLQKSPWSRIFSFIGANLDFILNAKFDLNLSKFKEISFIGLIRCLILNVPFGFRVTGCVLLLGTVSQSSSTPVPRLCLVPSSWQQAACSSGRVRLCYSETVQCPFTSCYCYRTAAVSVVHCRTCRHHWEMD